MERKTTLLGGRGRAFSQLRPEENPTREHVADECNGLHAQEPSDDEQRGRLLRPVGGRADRVPRVTRPARKEAKGKRELDARKIRKQAGIRVHGALVGRVLWQVDV